MGSPSPTVRFFFFLLAQKCSPDLPVIKPLGETILKALGFDPSLQRMRDDVGSLALVALVMATLSFIVFYAFTR